MKKRINIILLILVLGLWGTVIYKYLSQYFTKTEQFNSKKYTPYNSNSKIASKDTFTLKPLKRDPFLNKISIKTIPLKTTNAIPNKKTIPKKIEPVVEKPFPAITYLGYIKSTAQKNELLLLKINGKLEKYHNNETKNEIKIQKTVNDTLLATYQKTTKKIPLKKDAKHLNTMLKKP